MSTTTVTTAVYKTSCSTCDASTAEEHTDSCNLYWQIRGIPKNSQDKTEFRKSWEQQHIVLRALAYATNRSVVKPDETGCNENTKKVLDEIHATPIATLHLVCDEFDKLYQRVSYTNVVRKAGVYELSSPAVQNFWEENRHVSGVYPYMEIRLIDGKNKEEMACSPRMFPSYDIFPCYDAIQRGEMEAAADLAVVDMPLAERKKLAEETARAKTEAAEKTARAETKAAKKAAKLSVVVPDNRFALLSINETL